MYPTLTAHDAGHQKTLLWAIVYSVVMHGLIVTVLPNIQFDVDKTPDVLKIELVKKPEPPITKPEPPPEPAPIKPKTALASKNIPKPIVTPMPVVAKNAVDLPPPPTEVIAVVPKPDAPPSPVPPAPVVLAESPRPPVVNQADMDEARNQYGNSLWGAISREKKYPKTAQMRGWQGEAVVELLVDGNGKLRSKKIVVSSGHEVLDKQALEMVEKAAPYPTPPEVLRSASFTVTVPIPFKLE